VTRTLSGAPTDQLEDDDADASRATAWWEVPRRRWWTIARLALFTILTSILTFPDVREISTSIPGNPGDAYLVMTLLEWGGRSVPRLYRGFWDGPMFAGGEAAMAYSDTFLPLTVPFAVLRALFGRVVAFNLLYLVSWIFCAECTYRLALRMVRNRGAAVACAVAFTFSTIRLSQSGHFQLAWAGFVPLTVLLLMRYRDRPSVRRGVAVAASAVAQLLTSAYYGVPLLVLTAVVVIIEAALALRRHPVREVAGPPLAFLATVLVVMLPVQYAYHVADESAVPRDAYPAAFELHLGDLRAPSPTADLPRMISFFDREPDGRSENYAYIGAFAMLFVPFAVGMFVADRVRRRPFDRSRLGDWVIVAALGAFGFAFAVGRQQILGVRSPFYDLAVDVIPGLASTVAIVRFVIFAQLALVLVAGWGLARLLAARAFPAQALAVVAIVVLVATEAHQSHEVVDVVQPADGSVYDAMSGLDAGVVLELPIAGHDQGIVQAFLESTRMVLGTDDELRSVNGYSGHTPKGYDAEVPILNSFPSQESLELIARLGVDYVVLHTAPIDTGMSGVSDAVNASGFAYFDSDDAEHRIAAVPSEVIADRIDAADGIIIELAD
jgi:hypothetical protein